MHEGPMPRMRSWRRLARVSGRRCKLTGDVGVPHREHTAWVALADPRMQPPEPEVVVLRELHAKQHGCGLISAVDGVGDDILDAHELHRAILLWLVNQELGLRDDDGVIHE